MAPPLALPVSVLDFVSEPILVLDPDARISLANSPARNLLGVEPRGSSLFDFVSGRSGEVRCYLRAAVGTASPRPGAITVRVGGRPVRLHCLAARLAAPPGGTPGTILRLSAPTTSQFAELTRRFGELDARLRQRARENTRLQAALEENKLLVRELQHRVKNIIQTILAFLQMSSRDPHANTGEVLTSVMLRLRAMAAAQEAIYARDAVRSLPVQSFLGDVVAATVASFGASDALCMTIGAGLVTGEEAHLLTLIANELVTNACKHVSGDTARITVGFGVHGQTLCLEVSDTGPGLCADRARNASGLQLVEAMCGQLGGVLEMESRGGTVCRVSFRSELSSQKRGEDGGQIHRAG